MLRSAVGRVASYSLKAKHGGLLSVLILLELLVASEAVTTLFLKLSPLLDSAKSPAFGFSPASLTISSSPLYGLPTCHFPGLSSRFIALERWEI